MAGTAFWQQNKDFNKYSKQCRARTVAEYIQFMRNNILKIILSSLGVKYTDEYAERLYRESPARNSLSGLSYMLSVYGIEGKGYKDENKSTLHLAKPFVVQTDTGFWTVSGIKDGDVYCWDERGRHVVPGETFLTAWTGDVLSVKKKEGSGEPAYEKNHRDAWVAKIKSGLAILSCLVLFSALMLRQTASLTLALAVYVSLSVLGLWASVKLLQRKLYEGCERGAALDSAAGRTVGHISWSEVCVGYFLSNVILLALSLDTVSALGIVGVLMLPYTLWYLWTLSRKTRRRQALDVSVQTILWGLALVFCFAGLYQASFRPLMLLAIPLYCLAVLSAHLYAAKERFRDALEERVAARRAALCRMEVLLYFLRQQPYYEVGDEDATLLAGDPEADICLTLFYRSGDQACAEVQGVLARLLKNSARIKVRYVLVPEEGEVPHHEACVSKYIIKETPLLLINGYRMPPEYTYEDVEYILFERE